MFEEAFREEVVGKLSCLLEPVHALGEFVIYPTVMGALFGSTLIDDILRYHAELDACLLWAIKWSIEVEIVQVGCHELCIWCGECAVQHQFDRF